MNYKTLAKTSLKISEIGFGCMSLKGTEADNERLINTAIDLGINYFDTADLYDKGLNEIQLGKAIQTKRDQVIIATKVGNKWKSDGSGFDWDASKAYILKAVEESLKRLQTDRIDLYQLHGGTMDDNIHETIEAFELLQQQGKILHYGISSIRPNVIKEYVQRSGISSVMMQYSLLDRRPEESCLKLLKDNTISVLARGSVAGGLLVNKQAKQYLNYSEKEVKQAADAIQFISRKDRSAAQTAIQFVLQQPAVTSVVVGIRTMEQLEEAVKTTSAPKLTLSEIQKLSKALEVNYYEQHR